MSSFESVLANVTKHIVLEESEKSLFTSLLKKDFYPRKAVLQNPGAFCDRITFVDSGILRAYHLDHLDKEATIMFAMADWWITDIFAFTTQSPAMLAIETLEESTVYHLYKSDFDLLLNKIPKFEKFFRIIFQNAYVREQLRTIQNLSLSAESRYNNFIQKYPSVVQQVTQKQIASYLGITPEFLSLLRKKRP